MIAQVLGNRFWASKWLLGTWTLRVKDSETIGCQMMASGSQIVRVTYLRDLFNTN